LEHESPAAGIVSHPIAKAETSSLFAIISSIRP
jgi:hypothetical protein